MANIAYSPTYVRSVAIRVAERRARREPVGGSRGALGALGFRLMKKNIFATKMESVDPVLWVVCLYVSTHIRPAEMKDVTRGNYVAKPDSTGYAWQEKSTEVTCKYYQVTSVQLRLFNIARNITIVFYCINDRLFLYILYTPKSKIHYRSRVLQ